MTEDGYAIRFAAPDEVVRISEIERLASVLFEDRLHQTGLTPRRRGTGQRGGQVAPLDELQVLPEDGRLPPEPDGVRVGEPSRRPARGARSRPTSSGCFESPTSEGLSLAPERSVGSRGS